MDNLFFKKSRKSLISFLILLPLMLGALEEEPVLLTHSYTITKEADAVVIDLVVDIFNRGEETLFDVQLDLFSEYVIPKETINTAIGNLAGEQGYEFQLTIQGDVLIIPEKELKMRPFFWGVTYTDGDGVLHEFLTTSNYQFGEVLQ